jgi:hypothetical protein
MKITKRQLRQIILEVGEFSKMMFGKRIDVTYDGYYVDNVYFPYDRNNPETFRFLELYTWVDEYYPELLNAHKNVSFDKKEMMKNYYSLIFAPDRRGVNMNYQLIDRIEKRNEANEFLSFLLEQIKRGIMMTMKESRQRRNFILEATREDSWREKEPYPGYLEEQCLDFIIHGNNYSGWLDWSNKYIDDEEASDMWDKVRKENPNRRSR